MLHFSTPKLLRLLSFPGLSSALFILFTSQIFSTTAPFNFSKEDRVFLKRMSLSSFKQQPLSRGNEFTTQDDVASLGKQLFFDTRFSKNGEVSCATCHEPELYFTDGLVNSIGLDTVKRNAPSILFSPWSPWQFWDGRKDSMWSQALGPLTDSKEHGFSVEEVAHVIQQYYAVNYSALFPKIPKGNLTKPQAESVFVNVGKSLMAYQYKLKTPLSKFDRFANSIAAQNDTHAKNIFTLQELSGLKLFVGRANCISCHNGPLFTNFEFHNVGVPESNIKAVDLGRYSGVKELEKDPYNCLSKHSSATAKECLEIRFLKNTGPELVGAFKTPSLRNAEKTGPYMHSGQFATLEDVINHYNKPKPPFYDKAQHPNRPHFDILPLALSDNEKASLVAFLKTLTSPIPKNDTWWQRPKAPSL